VVLKKVKEYQFIFIYPLINKNNKNGMHISIKKKLFSEAVHNVARFAERRNTTLPVLAAILVIAGDDGIKMRATNLETGVDLILEGVCHSTGVVAIPATLLHQFASSLLSDGDITLECTGDVLTITDGTGTRSLKTVSYDDFPSIPLPEKPKGTITLPGTLLHSLLSSLASCASPSTVRPELASIYLVIEGGILTATATDSFRLAEKKIPLKNTGAQGSLLLPAKNALDIAQALPHDEITITFNDHQCAFSHSPIVLVSRLTNATYPDYRQIIPKEFTVEAVVLRKDFEQALKQTAVFSDAFQKVRIRFDPKKHTLTFSSKNSDIGESVETVSARVTGNALELSFNYRYLASIFPLTTTESISLSAAGVGRTLIIRGVGDTSLTYLVSPMNQ